MGSGGEAWRGRRRAWRRATAAISIRRSSLGLAWWLVVWRMLDWDLGAGVTRDPPA